MATTHIHTHKCNTKTEREKKNFFNFQSEMNSKRTSHEIVDYVHVLGEWILNPHSVELSLNKFAINVGDISFLSTVSVAMKFVLCKRNLLTHNLHLFVLFFLFFLKYISFVTASNGIGYCSSRCTACLLTWFGYVHFLLSGSIF